MDDEEVLSLRDLKGWDLGDDDIKFYCNNVPREMRLLVSAGMTETYMQPPPNQMQQILVTHFQQSDKFAVSLMLQYLFQERNLGVGDVLVPFIDLGFVYRTWSNGALFAFPLCRPAEIALMELWKSEGMHGHAFESRMALRSRSLCFLPWYQI
jgi:hypothetical protein